MKNLLLAAGLLLCFSAQAQGWAGSLPVDSVSGSVVYQGSVEAGCVAAAVLRRRAVKYTAGMFSRDTVQTLTGNSQQEEGRYTVGYQLTIWPTTYRYRYELHVIGFAYPVRVGEGAVAGRLSPIVERRFLLLDELRKGTAQPAGDIFDWQATVERVAQRAVAKAKAAMLGR